jgi:flagellar hook-length control protein FliK
MRPTTLALPPRLDAPEWSEAFANRVAWAANSNVQVAELRLNPPQLGHVGVQIAIQNNRADIAIATPHAEVLASIEAALPRLREMFGESGVALGDVNVSQRDPGETPDQDRDTHPRAKFLAAREVTGETELPLKPLHQGLVDHYV